MSHFRYSKLKDNWVIIAEERSHRPGLSDTPVEEPLQKSPFIYGHEHLTPAEIFALRDGDTAPNTPGWKTRVVPNKYKALSIEEDAIGKKEGFFESFGGFGAHEVIIDTPDAAKSPGHYSLDEFSDLLTTVQQRCNDLKEEPRIAFIQVFKNHGKKAGATISHTHTQLIALPFIPKQVEEEIHNAREYYRQNSRNLFMDELQAELESRERIVYENGGFAAFCPYASFFPFEIRIASKISDTCFYSMEKCVMDELSEVVQQVCHALEHAVNDVAYNLMLKLAPIPRDHKEFGYFHHMDRFYQWYIEITPRIYNFAGFELGTGQYINPVAPERCAKYLKEKRAER